MHIIIIRHIGTNVQQSMSGTQYKHKTLATDLAIVVYVYTRMPKPSKLRKNNDVIFSESGIFFKNSGMPVALMVLQ